MEATMAQCHATCKATGMPCRRQAIAGATVCRVHGAAAPQVKEAARVRLLALVDPALGVLARAIKPRRKLDNLALAASRDVLDRAGIGERPVEATGAGVSIQLMVVPAGADPSAGSIDLRSLVRGPGELTAPSATNDDPTFRLGGRNSNSRTA
jgi:hypothetical protein